jgi:hypothetical protein
VVEYEVCLFGTERWGAAEALSQPQPTIEVLDHPIAFTGGLFEAFAVQYLYRTAQVLNHTGVFQSSRRQSDTRTSGAEHLRKEFMGQRQQGGIDSILTHEQPASQTLFDVMQAVAGCELGDLHAMHEGEAADF